MARLGFERSTLEGGLQGYGEDELAERAATMSEAQIAEVGERAGHYAFSEEALSFGGSMGGMRALALAAVDVLEGGERDLRVTRNDFERKHGWPTELSDEERVRDQAVRAHFAT